MIVVVEGCDCTGKSTFANELSRKTGFEVMKGSSFEISQLGTDKMFEYMMELLDNKNIIIDRFFYSNLVYGKLYDFPTMTRKQCIKLRDKLNSNALLIYFHAPTSVIEDRMSIRGDDRIKVDEIGRIQEKYKSILDDEGLSPKTMISFNTFKFNTDIATSMVAGFIDLDETKIHIKHT